MHLPPVRLGNLSHPSLVSGGEVSQVVAENGPPEVSVIAMALGELPLAVPRTRRAPVHVVVEVTVPTAHPGVIIDPPPAEVPAVVRPQRIVAVTPVESERRIDSPAGRPAVPVAVVVMGVPGPHEHVQVQPRKVDHAKRPVVETRLPVNRTPPVDRGEANAAVDEPVVPVSGDKHVTAGRPHVMGGHPDPPLMPSGPIAGLPSITSLLMVPMAARPEVIVRRRRACRAAFQRFGRGGQVVHLMLFQRRPESGHPLIPAGHFLKVTGNPAAADGRNPIHARNPNEILPLVVPRPIALEPDGVGIRLEVRRHLVDRLRRFVRDDQSGFRIEGYRRGEPLVHEAAHQVFGIAVFLVPDDVDGRRFRHYFLRAGPSTSNEQQHPCGRKTAGHDGPS